MVKLKKRRLSTPIPVDNLETLTNEYPKHSNLQYLSLALDILMSFLPIQLVQRNGRGGE